MLTPHVTIVGAVHDSCHRAHSVAAGDVPASDYNAYCSECRHYHSEAAPCIRPLGGTRVL